MVHPCLSLTKYYSQGTLKKLTESLILRNVKNKQSRRANIKMSLSFKEQTQVPMNLGFLNFHIHKNVPEIFLNTDYTCVPFPETLFQRLCSTVVKSMDSGARPTCHFVTYGTPSGSVSSSVEWEYCLLHGAVRINSYYL